MLLAIFNSSKNPFRRSLEISRQPPYPQSRFCRGSKATGWQAHKRPSRGEGRVALASTGGTAASADGNSVSASAERARRDPPPVTEFAIEMHVVSSSPSLSKFPDHPEITGKFARITGESPSKSSELPHNISRLRTNSLTRNGEFKKAEQGIFRKVQIQGASH